MVLFFSPLLLGPVKEKKSSIRTDKKKGLQETKNGIHQRLIEYFSKNVKKCNLKKKMDMMKMAMKNWITILREDQPPPRLDVESMLSIPLSHTYYVETFATTSQKLDISLC